MPAARGSAQGIYWLLTIRAQDWSVPDALPDGIAWIKGQRERGGQGGYEHWQLIVGLKKKQRLSFVRTTFGGTAHCELSRSAAAEAYVWKEDTRVEGSQFELGERPIKRNSKADWDRVRDDAKCGRLDAIPGDVYVRYYNNLRRIAADHLTAAPVEREIVCYWGRTGTGKSRRAWSEAGMDAYPKDPNTKFWCGYRGHEHVVVDEFRGLINISNLLRWLDRYPCLVEVKGSAVALCAKKIWFTSNISPEEWYPDLDEETKAALRRRMTVIHFM